MLCGVGGEYRSMRPVYQRLQLGVKCMDADRDRDLPFQSEWRIRRHAHRDEGRVPRVTDHDTSQLGGPVANLHNILSTPTALVSPNPRK